MATRLAAEMTRICSAHTGSRDHLGGRRRTAPRGQGGPAGPHPGQPSDLLRAVGQDLGVPGDAQGSAVRRRPRARPVSSSTCSPRWSGPPPIGRTSSPDAQAMRKRVVAHIPARDAGRELKLGEGGLRDVEFSVQLLQLVHGRVDERLRVRATLPALKALVDNGYVGREDGKGFALSYRFLRALEHRIQLFNLRRTHVLPDNEDDLRRLGRSLGYADPVNELISTWRHTAQGVRRLHERLFYSPLLDTVARIPSAGAAADHRRRPGSVEGAGLRRPEGRAAPHRRAQPGGHPAGRDPAAAAAGDARLVRRRAQPRPWSAGVPPGVRGVGQHSVVPPGPARRGGDGRPAGPHPGLQPVRGATPHPGAADRADAGRRRRAAAPLASGPAGRDARRRESAGRHGRRGGGDPGHPSA